MNMSPCTHVGKVDYVTIYSAVIFDNGNGNGIYIPHFLYVYIQMRFTFNHPTHES